MPDKVDVSVAQPTDDAGDGLEQEDEQPTTKMPPKAPRRQTKRNKPEGTSEQSKVQRKRSTPKLRRDADKEASTMASDEARELLKNRTALVCKLRPIVSKSRLNSKQLSTDDLDFLLLPPAAREPNLDKRMLMLFEAMGSCKPLPFNALCGNRATDVRDRDDIEDAVPVPKRRPERSLSAQQDAEEEIEQLRDARPSASGSEVIPPISHQPDILEDDQRETVQADIGPPMHADANDIDSPAMHLPEIDADLLSAPDMNPDLPPAPGMDADLPSPPGMDADLPPADVPCAPESDMQPMDAQPMDVQPLDMLPERPSTDTPAAMPDVATLPTGDDLPAPHSPAQDSAGRSQGEEANHPAENTPVETLYSVPGTQGTTGADDSLNVHTLRTLDRLEKLSQASPFVHICASIPWYGEPLTDSMYAGCTRFTKAKAANAHFDDTIGSKYRPPRGGKTVL